MINVAIIEDDKVFLERVSAVIGQSSYCKLVGVAHDFESGSRLIKETSIHVCIVDLGLPDGDGCDLIAMGRALGLSILLLCRCSAITIMSCGPLRQVLSVTS